MEDLQKQIEYLAIQNLQMREALEKLSEQVAISAQDSFGTCKEWLDSFRLEAPGECAAYEESVAVLSGAQPAVAWLAQERAEAAAKELEEIAKDKGNGEGRAYLANVIYREFPDRLITRIAVVEAGELMDRAAALRAGKGVGDE